jgi:hypothetical protein
MHRSGFATILFLLAATAPVLAQQPQGDCGYYTNSLGHEVPRPCGDARTQAPPPGATAICRDGSYSYSEHPYSGGTCSHHGGVAKHLR